MFPPYAGTFKIFKKTSTWEWHQNVGLISGSVPIPLLGPNSLTSRDIWSQTSRFHGFLDKSAHFKGFIHRIMAFVDLASLARWTGLLFAHN